MKKTAKQWKKYYSGPEFQENYLYQGTDLGAVCGEGKTQFRLWSPSAKCVSLNLYHDGNEASAFAVYPMKRQEKGVWGHEISKNLHKVYYDYTLKIEGKTVTLADPYARACGVNGRRSMAVDLKQTDPKNWQEDQAPSTSVEPVIYELHVKEFSWDAAGGFPEEVRGKYSAFLHTDTTLNGDGLHPTGITYLKELGVTHIQLMPVYDFGSVDEAGDGSQFNWGYDPVNYNVPEGSYATDAEHGEVRIRELKEMIMSLHSQGFRVIMDVVYNHTYSLDSWFQKAAPWYYYRVNEDGTVSNGSGCGNDVASERAMCGKYILESVLYWCEEYHMDGFRFDLMGLLDVDLMNEIRAALDQRYGAGRKLMYGEPWSADRTAMEHGAVPALKYNMKSLDSNIGMFCDNTRDAVKGSVFKLDQPGFVNGGRGFEYQILNSVGAWCRPKDCESLAKAPSQIITYVSAHDNQTLWDKLSETTESVELRKKEYRLAAGIYMTCQGSLFLLSGEEFARTKDGLEDSYHAPVALNRLDWSKAWDERELVEYYKGLIALRTRLPGLCDKSENAGKRICRKWKRKGIVGFSVKNSDIKNPSPWSRLQIVYNSRQKAETVKLEEGEWQILADGEDSFRWRRPTLVSGEAEAAPVSILVLGKINQERN